MLLANAQYVNANAQILGVTNGNALFESVFLNQIRTQTTIALRDSWSGLNTEYGLTVDPRYVMEDPPTANCNAWHGGRVYQGSVGNPAETAVAMVLFDNNFSVGTDQYNGYDMCNNTRRHSLICVEQ